MPQPTYPVPVAPDGRPLAGPGQRLGARIIDSIIVMVTLLVVAGVIIGGGGRGGRVRRTPKPNR